MNDKWTSSITLESGEKLPLKASPLERLASAAEDTEIRTARVAEALALARSLTENGNKLECDGVQIFYRVRVKSKGK